MTPTPADGLTFVAILLCVILALAGFIDWRRWRTGL